MRWCYLSLVASFVVASCTTPPPGAVSPAAPAKPAPTAAAKPVPTPTPKPAPAPSPAPSPAPAPAPAPEAAPAPQTSAAGERQPASQWKTNDAALKLIEDSEGLRLTAYSNGGQWLIGYGHAKGVTQGMTITKDQAVDFLRQDVHECEGTIAGAVTVPVTGNEFGAMVSLCFNIGNGNFRKSSLVSKLNAGDRAGAADAFLAWVKAGGKEVPHLVERRKAERALFLA